MLDPPQLGRASILQPGSQTNGVSVAHHVHKTAAAITSASCQRLTRVPAHHLNISRVRWYLKGFSLRFLLVVYFIRTFLWIKVLVELKYVVPPIYLNMVQ